MASKDRRALFRKNDNNYDPFVGINADEYLIENYPRMSFEYRRAVWSTIQSDSDFDYKPLWDLLDSVVKDLADNYSPHQSKPVSLDDDNNSSDGDSEEIFNNVSSES